MKEDWVILEAVDEAMRPVPDGTLSATVLMMVLANDVLRYDLGDCVRFHTAPWSCGSSFRSFQVEGREATLVRVAEVMILFKSPEHLREGQASGGMKTPETGDELAAETDRSTRRGRKQRSGELFPVPVVQRETAAVNHALKEPSSGSIPAVDVRMKDHAACEQSDSRVSYGGKSKPSGSRTERYSHGRIRLTFFISLIR